MRPREGQEEDTELQRFTLKDMRLAAASDRVDEGAKRSRMLPGKVAIAWSRQQRVRRQPALRLGHVIDLDMDARWALKCHEGSVDSNS